MYSDETRDPDEIEALRREDARAHFDEFWTKYLSMAAREKGAEFEPTGGKQGGKKKGAAKQRAMQYDALAQANAALSAYRTENKRLKDDLKRLRTSRTYQMGRWLAHPVTMAKQQAQGISQRTGASKKSLLSAPSAPSSPAPGSATTTPPQGSKATASHATQAATQQAATNPQRRSSGTSSSADALIATLDSSPTPAALLDVLQQGWNVSGSISAVCEALRRHEPLIDEMESWGQALAARALGEERLLTHGVTLPPRAPGSAHHAERHRILYCAHSTPAFQTNGYSTRTGGIVSGLRSEGNDVVVVGRAGYPWDTNAETKQPKPRRWSRVLDGVEYIHLPGADLTRTPLDHYFLQAADAYVREARLQRPSLIHAASNHRTALPALIAARRLGLPFTYEVRGLWEITEASDNPGFESTERYALQVSLENLVLTEADSVLAITEELRDELIARGVAPERIRLAPNAVDPDEFLPLPKDEEYAATLQLPLDHPVIGFAGSMVEYEGLDLLVESAALLRDRGAHFTMAIAGSGKAEADLRRQIERLGLTEQVHLLGRLPNEDMPRLLSLFDIMPLPRRSLPVTEMVSPLKPLEALSSAKAIVLSDVKPHRVYTGADDPSSPARGVLVPAGDAETLADALAALLDDPDRRADLGRAGRLWCLANRTWSSIATEVEKSHADARRVQSELAAATPSRRLDDLRVGLIADQFTSETLGASMQTVPLDRAGWRAQLDGLDLIFVESAWKGNGGQWFRGVGQYDDDEHADIRALLTAARELGIPSVFWNKEDPVHFARFVGTASLCDHVFTTDANMIGAYLAKGIGTVRTASALPFYAQPRIHNPLPSARPFEHTVAYAGTFYGQRFAKRSAELASLLHAAQEFGLTIYDRQADDPDSPYRFPPDLQPFVRGSLPYDEVIDAYGSHVANLNVNSVSDSPSMFSRRVVEIAACGGIVLSGPGRGIEETFGSAIPVSDDPPMWRTWLASWASDPQARLAEAWLQMRAVLRAHTVDTALTILARTAGIPVTGPRQPSYALVLRTTDADQTLSALANQSTLPRQVVASVSDDHRSALEALGIAVVPLSEVTTDFIGVLDDATLSTLTRTWFEDVLLADSFGPWERIEAGPDPDHQVSSPIAAPTTSPTGGGGLVSLGQVHDGAVDEALHRTGLNGVRLTTVPRKDLPEAPSADAITEETSLAGRTVLIAGHDLKFAGALITSLQDAGATVLIDQWENHTKHDESASLERLRQADTVWCEWGLGNAEWYSHHVSPHQRLIVRVHLQELQRPFLRRIKHSAVTTYIFIGELIRQAAIRGHGVPAETSVMIPNMVDAEGLALPKHADASQTLGLVGIVPERKRLDLALDVLEGLLGRGLDYRLRIKGKTAADFPWMADRPEELAYFDRQNDRVERINRDHPGAVVFDGHGADMAEWYQHIGVALSTSDFESFHFTIADGAASGAMPAALAWAGADLLYPMEWLSPTVEHMVDRIASSAAQGPRDQEAAAADAALIERTYGQRRVLERLLREVAG